MSAIDTFRENVLPAFAGDERCRLVQDVLDWIENDNIETFDLSRLIEFFPHEDEAHSMANAMWAGVVLSASSAPVLDIVLTFRDKAGQYQVDVKRDEDGEYIIHPVSGERLGDFHSNTYLSFAVRRMEAINTPSP